MLQNTFVTCDMCNSLINMRVQATDQKVPFYLECPTCGSNIQGEFKPKKYRMQLTDIKNITESDEPDEDISYYSFELSAEFVTRKVKYKKLIDFELSPFLKNGPNTFSTESLSKAHYFQKYIEDGKWNKLLNWITLFSKGKDKFLYKNINEALLGSGLDIPNPENKIELYKTLNNLLLFDAKLILIAGKDGLEHYKNTRINIESIQSLLTEYVNENAEDLKKQIVGFRTDFIGIISDFAKIYSQFLPVVSLRISETFDEIDKQRDGLTTIDYKQLNNFYSETYEFILKNNDIIFKLNNLLKRQDANSYANNKSAADFNKMGSYQKMMVLISQDSEPFSKPLKKSVFNRIRNSVAHYDVSVDYKNQLITYKDRNKQEELYYLDLANLCLDNMATILYLNDLYYVLSLKYVLI